VQSTLQRQLKAPCSVSSKHPAASVQSTLQRQLKAPCSVSRKTIGSASSASSALYVGICSCFLETLLATDDARGIGHPIHIEKRPMARMPEEQRREQRERQEQPVDQAVFPPRPPTRDHAEQAEDHDGPVRQRISEGGPQASTRTWQDRKRRSDFSETVRHGQPRALAHEPHRLM